MRVIQDSDDEFEEDLEPEVLPPDTQDASTKHSKSHGSASEWGTGSTGSAPPT